MSSVSLTLIPIPWEKFGNRRQSATIAAGASGRVYLYEIPVPYVGFLTHLYCSFFANTYIEMRIDGHLSETFREQVGDIEDPFEYDPPYLITRDIEFIGYNNDSSSHVFEIKCDGKIFDEVIARREAFLQEYGRSKI